MLVFLSIPQDDISYSMLIHYYNLIFAFQSVVLDTSSESSTSSSSEESQDDNASSIDSRDFGYIKQDLNVCPKGCEPAIYDLTVELRSQR